MKSLILSFAFAIIASVANAGTITLSIDTGSTQYTNSVTVSAANLQRLLAAYQTIYTTVDAAGNPVVPNAAATAKALSGGLFQGIINNVLQVEKEKTAKDAVAGVAPITSTP